MQKIKNKGHIKTAKRTKSIILMVYEYVNINVAANGVTKSTITLQVKDAYGNDLTTSGLAVNMETTGSATISKVVYSGNGTYTATITNTKIENVVITANIVYIFDKEYVVNTAMVSFKTAVSTQKSTLRLPKQIYVVSEIAEKFSSVIFESRNSDGDLIDVTNMADLLDVVMETTGSAILGEVTYIGGGFYKASISNTKAETVAVSVKIYGLDVVNTINVAFVPGVVDPDRSFMYEGGSERWEIYKWIHLQMRDKYDNDVIDTSGLEVTFKSSSNSEHFGELRIIEESKVYGNFGKRFTSTYKMEVFSRAYINGEPTGASIRFSIGNVI